MTTKIVELKQCKRIRSTAFSIILDSGSQRQTSEDGVGDSNVDDDDFVTKKTRSTVDVLMAPNDAEGAGGGSTTSSAAFDPTELRTIHSSHIG